MIALHTDIVMSDDLRGRVISGVTNSRHIDHNARFVTADGVGHDLAGIHVTTAPHAEAGAYEPHPWKSSEMPVNPYIAIEDASGSVFPLTACSVETESRHALGFIARTGDNEYWLLSLRETASTRHELSLDDLRDGHFDVIRLHGQSDECVGMIGPISDVEIGMVAEGEFDYSVEDCPILTGCGWWSDMGRNDPDQPAHNENDAAKIRAIEDLIERERSPGIGMAP